MRRALTAICLVFVFVSIISAQDHPEVKIGKIKPEDFSVQSALIDSNTNAIIISDVGKSEFTGNSRGWFSLIFNRQQRIKILNDKGFDLASISIPLYFQGSDKEKLLELKVFTYNLENGTVVTQKLESKDVFEEKKSKNLVLKKFTCPGVKAGSVIDISYSIKSDFLFNLQPWTFQSEYPCLWSEYTVGIPDLFNYVFLGQRYKMFDVNSSKDYTFSFVIAPPNEVGPTGGGFERYNCTVHEKKWAMKDVQPMKEENFTTTIDNHISKVEFQLSQLRYPDNTVKDVMGTWQSAATHLLNSDEFGRVFNAANNFLEDEVDNLTKNTANEEDKARNIYSFVRDNFVCKSRSGIYMGDLVSLRDVFKNRNGTAAELNLLLLAMLRKADIKCNPVLLSLRERGLVNAIYPMLNKFNYVICEAYLGGKKAYLDASRAAIGFGKLDKSCYNGVAWVIEKKPYSINLPADSLLEQSNTLVVFTNAGKGKYTGSYSSKLGDNASAQFREQNANLTSEEMLKNFKKIFPNEVDVSKLNVDSFSKKDFPVSLKCDLETEFTEDIIYFNPLLGRAKKENPFKPGERLYPVEMPFAQNEVYTINLEIPEGYDVDELPKSLRLKLNDDGGVFEYLCVKSDFGIQLRSRLVIMKANFAKEEYEFLREFYGHVIRKQAEQIVFKKKTV
ncbi:MAG: DUF3857 domain-containing protein [Sediminibacterium sp.]|nr:DUF3857 domain-containing protein [Sediminibacterium sp.]